MVAMVTVFVGAAIEVVKAVKAIVMRVVVMV